MSLSIGPCHGKSLCEKAWPETVAAARGGLLAAPAGERAEDGSPPVGRRDLRVAGHVLELDHVAVAAAAGHQLGVRAGLDDGAGVEHEDAVGPADRAEAVGDDE